MISLYILKAQPTVFAHGLDEGHERRGRKTASQCLARAQEEWDLASKKQ